MKEITGTKEVTEIVEGKPEEMREVDRVDTQTGSTYKEDVEIGSIYDPESSNYNPQADSE